jgi:5-formyltetrahydrofolate cyclo-ligase
MGIPEPAVDATTVAPERVEVAVVPGVAFDRHGRRLGYGRGFYDRWLARAPKALRVGVCHAFQLVDGVPARDGDVPMHIIITPEEVVMTESLQRNP